MSRNLRKKNIGATACRAWARAETFNGLQKVLQILCVPGLTTLWTYPISDEDTLMKAKKMKEFFLKREMKKCIFGRNPKASYLMTNTWVVQKNLYPCCLSWGRMASVSFVSFEKYELQMKKNFRNFFKSLFLPKKRSRKKFFDAIFWWKCNLWNACILYETMNPVSGLGSEK